MKSKIAVLFFIVLLCLTSGCSNTSHIAEQPAPVSPSGSNEAPSQVETAQATEKLPDILTDDGYPDVQAFMKTYRKAEAIVTQYNQDLAEWEQAVKNGQKPAEKQHRPPERQSVRNRLRQLQEEGKQNSQPKQRKKSQDRDR